MATTQVREFVKVPEGVKEGVNAVLERIEKIDAEGERLIRSAIDLGREQIEKLELPKFNGRGKAIAGKLAERYEDGLGVVLGLFNLPTRRDVEEVNRRVDKLAKRVGALGKAPVAAKRGVAKHN